MEGRIVDRRAVCDGLKWKQKTEKSRLRDHICSSIRSTLQVLFCKELPLLVHHVVEVDVVMLTRLIPNAELQPPLLFVAGQPSSDETGNANTTRPVRASSPPRTRRQISHKAISLYLFIPPSHAAIALLIQQYRQPPSQQLLAPVRPCDTRRQTITAHLLPPLTHQQHHHYHHHHHLRMSRAASHTPYQHTYNHARSL